MPPQQRTPNQRTPPRRPAIAAPQAGMDYSALKTHLASGDVRKADDETRALLIKLAGPAAVKRNWVYFSEVQFIPVKDLQTMDALWRAASGGKFGYSVQARAAARCGVAHIPPCALSASHSICRRGLVSTWCACSMDAPDALLPVS